MSDNFQAVDFNHLTWPHYLRIDYVRIYQKADHISLTCDPKDYPTAEYIENHIEVYNNPNITTWEGGRIFIPQKQIEG